jgi:putative iron-regulated protein
MRRSLRILFPRVAALARAALLCLLGLPALAPAAPSPSAVVQHYARLVEASYADSLATARRMQRAIDAFLAQPSADSLDGARHAWREAREWYGQTEAYRFYGGPIDGRGGPEPRINAWPIDESYIDSVRGWPQAGIINERTVRINARQLIQRNEFGGEENVATGWHAIEFLLWGQDFDASSPGARLYTDYVDRPSRNADRRRAYLRVVTVLLVQDLTSLRDAWTPGRRNYRMRFERLGNEALRRMFVGLGSLARAELAGERLEVALATQDQEDEQSCFSDNTHRDLVANALGLQNVWLGRYRRIDGRLLEGPSLRDLVAARDSVGAERTTHALTEVLDAVNAIQPPFDQEIRGGDEAPGRQRVRAVIESLKRLSHDLVSSASSIGIETLTLVQRK